MNNPRPEPSVAMRPVKVWTSVSVTMSQVHMRPGEWVQIVCYPNEFGDEGIKIVQVLVQPDGRIEIASDVPSRPWDKDRSGPKETTDE